MAEGIGSVFAIIDKLAGASLATGLLLLIYAIWKGELTFGRELKRCREDYQTQLDAAGLRHKEELTQLRADMRLTIDAEKSRGDRLWELLLDGRSLVRQSVEATAKLAERGTVRE